MSSYPLLKGFYETAYVTRDMDAALDRMKRRDGISRFHVFAPPATRGATSHLNKVAKTFIGDRMIEILEPNPAVDSIFAGFIPEKPGDLRLHHLGYLVEDDEHWDGIRANAAQDGLEIAYEGFVPDLIRVMYIDTRAELGHYSEHIQNYAGGLELLNIIPRN